MPEIIFDWDDAKNVLNIRKQGVSFDDAKSVFYDEHARLIPDNEHSSSEDRFIILGLNFQAKTLVVAHCYRQNDEIIRIISARKADKEEIKQYFKHRGI